MELREYRESIVGRGGGRRWMLREHRSITPGIYGGTDRKGGEGRESRTWMRQSHLLRQHTTWRDNRRPRIGSGGGLLPGFRPRRSGGDRHRRRHDAGHDIQGEA